jgi:hypothetical protein
MTRKFKTPTHTILPSRTYTECGYPQTEIELKPLAPFDATAELVKYARSAENWEHRDRYMRALATLAKIAKDPIHEVQGYGRRTDITITWQHYGEHDYCSPRFDLGSEVYLIEESLKTVKKILGDRRNPESPSVFVDLATASGLAAELVPVDLVPYHRVYLSPRDAEAWAQYHERYTIAA